MTDQPTPETGDALPIIDELALVVVSKSGCPYCTKIKTMLDRMGESYVEMKLDDDDDRAAFYDNHIPEGQPRTVPQVFLRGKRIGGYTDFVTRVAQGPLH